MKNILLKGVDMSKIEVPFTKYLDKTVEIMRDPGLLLVSVDKDGQPNVMAIGWGLIGVIWRKPVFIVAVRPSRYTYKLIEETGDFTVNVPSKDMSDIVEYCGTVSGRDHDKFKEKNLKAVPSKYVKSPIIDQCLINYECKVIYKTKLEPAIIPRDVKSLFYPGNDYHTLYFGEIQIVHVDEEAITKKL